MGKLIKRKIQFAKMDNIYLSPTTFSDHFPVETGLPYGGGLLFWLTQQDVHSLPCKLPDLVSSTFCMPSLFTNQLNSQVYPKFIGIDNTTSQQTIMAAVIEGIILELVHCKISLQSSGELIDEVLIGGTNRLLIQHAEWLANALQCKVTLLKNSELTSSGLAMIAISTIKNQQNYFVAAEILAPEVLTSYQPNTVTELHWHKRLQMYNAHKKSCQLVS